MNDLNLEIRTWQEVDEWDDFVGRHPHGHIYHTSAMIRAFAATKNHTPLAIAAVDQTGAIRSLLVAVRVMTLGRWGGPFAARSILFAEPINTDDSEGLLATEMLLAEHDRLMRSRVLFTEIRPMHASGVQATALEHCHYDRLGYLNYESDLSVGADALFSRLNGKCRNGIRTSFRRGLTVRSAKPEEYLRRCYEIFQYSHSLSQVPLADISLFESTFAELPADQWDLMVAEYEGNLVAAATFLYYSGRVTYWYAGALRVPGIAAMACVLWQAMQSSAEKGMRTFDFCGAGWEGEDYGPGKFKSKFGGELTNYGRYRRIYAPWKLRCAESAYTVLRKFLAPRTTLQDKNKSPMSA